MSIGFDVVCGNWEIGFGAGSSFVIMVVILRFYCFMEATLCSENFKG